MSVDGYDSAMEYLFESLEEIVFDKDFPNLRPWFILHTLIKYEPAFIEELIKDDSRLLGLLDLYRQFEVEGKTNGKTIS